MYLKKLEAQGFKSFADKVCMEFGKGITAIVGPNGSGKSNIADAIRWVMGEQSAKTLRGGSMQDVIFAGTQRRKALGFAEVSLYVDNTEKHLPIDYDEVVITRRVFRSGESEYFINKASCRLKDIHELFMDTGVGRDGYSIIGQGKIAEIIGSKAEDRRQIFEEAAGITKYRYRKEEAERKLERTKENVTRIDDIITELQLQLEPLGLQAEKAKKFLNLRDRLKVLEVNVSLDNIEKFKKIKEETDAICSDVGAQLFSVKEKIEKLEEDNTRLFEEMRLCGEEMEAKQELQSENVATLSNLKSDIEVLKSKIGYNNESVRRIETEIDELNLKIVELEQSLSDKDGDIEGLLAKEADLQRAISALEEEVSALARSEQEKNIAAQQIGAEIIEKMNQASSARSKIGNYKALSDSFEARAEAIEKELSTKEKEYQDLAVSTEEIRLLLDEKNKAVSQLSQKHRHISREIDTKQEEFQNKQKNRQQIQISLEKAQSRGRLLEDMEKSFDNYSKSVRAVMQSHQNGELKGTGILGTVAQLLKVPEKYTLAMEAALGAIMQNIVTKTEEDAKRAIEFLKRTKAGRATFLPVSASRGGILEEKGLEQNKGYIALASRLVSYDKSIEPVVNYLLGRVVVVDSIDSAVAMARKYNYRFRIVTLEGDLLTPGGAMSGGSRSGGVGLFARANELRQLKKAIEQLEADFEKAGCEVEDIKQELEQYNDKAREIAHQLKQANEECISLDLKLKHSQDLLESMEKGRQASILEQSQISQRISEMAKEISTLEREIQLLSEDTAELEKQADIHKAQSQTAASQREEKSGELVSLKMSLADVKKDIQLHSERVELVMARKLEIERSIDIKEQNIEEIQDKNEDLLDDIEFKSQQTSEIEEENIELKEEIERLRTRRRQIEEEIKEKQQELAKEREAQLKLKEELSRIENRRTKTEVELENTISRLWEEYELTISTAQQLRTDVGSISTAQKEIASLRNEIKSLGNINIDAIEEYASIKERFDFLTSQRSDLVEAQKDLEKVIYDMVSIMKEQFFEKFKVINENFSEVFAEIFGGGSAKLSLTEPDNVLESGVNIDVQPPGKAVKNMILLSGGEQALVSIALLFAILKVRPAPFCVLDEIEAALDDVNVYRFADFLKRFAQDSQFIVVTHRRGTMEAANMLYGVTMQEQGVTNILALNIDQVEIEGVK
jgi:chromosome segregation protein